VTTSRYRYQLEILKYDYTPVGQLPITPDWQPAIEWARLGAIRAGSPIGVVAASGTVDPIWNSEAGQPYISGFKVSVDGEPARASEFEITYWRSLARAAAATLIEKKVLLDGEQFRYRVAAFPRTDAPSSRGKLDSGVTEVAPDLQLSEGNLADMVAAGSPVGAINPSDPPVFIPSQLIREAVKMKAEAQATETGSVLIGRLCIDRRGPAAELFAVVTAHVPARYTSNELTRMTFTADTWADVHNAISLRGAGEVMLAWFHTHPTRHFCTCEDCDRSRCSLNTDFFSLDDQLLHRSVFPRAWTSALVISDVMDESGTWTDSCSLFGWRDGAIVERGFYEFDPDRADRVATTDGGKGGTSIVKRSGNPVLGSTVGGGRRGAGA